MIPLDLYPPLVAIWLFVVGLFLGRLLNVAIDRVPDHEELEDQLKALCAPIPPCWHCSGGSQFCNRIPFFSWVARRGYCPHRAVRIPRRWPILEIGNALLLILLYCFEVPWHSGAVAADSSLHTPIGPTVLMTTSSLSSVAILNLRFVYHAILLEALVAATVIDFKLKIIPDATTVPAMGVGLLGAFAFGQLYLVPVWFQDPVQIQSFQSILPDWMDPLFSDRKIPRWIEFWPHIHGLAVSAAGLLVGGGIVWAVRLIGFWTLRQEAMGFGDVVLMACIGSFIGWQPVTVVFFLAPACAVVMALVSWLFHGQREIPYGPYLSLATLLTLLAWQPIWSFAEPIFSLGPIVPLMGIVMAVLMGACLLLIRLVKLLLGIPLYEEDLDWEWTSADQLIYQSSENDDDQQGRWRKPQRWPGIDSGLGRGGETRWRDD